MAQGVAVYVGKPARFWDVQPFVAWVERSKTQGRRSNFQALSRISLRSIQAARPRLIRGRGLRAREPVLAVNILAELHDAVAAGPSGDVDPVQRHGLGHLGVLALAGLDDAVDILERPAARLLQHPGDELAHILHPHAARRMEAEI